MAALTRRCTTDRCEPAWRGFLAVPLMRCVQLFVFGLETMQALSKTSYLICGLGGLGVEVGGWFFFPLLS